MATLVKPTNVQKMEFDVTTAEGPSRVTIVTGRIEKEDATSPLVEVVGTTAASDTTARVRQRDSIKVLLAPTLTPGKFRRAAATASWGDTRYDGLAVTATGAISANSARWVINDAQATFDDETNQVQLVIDVSVEVSGISTAIIGALMFQVTTLAMV